MSHKQCPVCFGELEVRPVQPCFVCGGWTKIEPSKPEHYFAIRDDGTPLTLCDICWLEEILSDRGDLKERLRIKSDLDLVFVSDRPPPLLDKFVRPASIASRFLKSWPGGCPMRSWIVGADDSAHHTTVLSQCDCFQSSREAGNGGGSVNP